MSLDVAAVVKAVAGVLPKRRPIGHHEAFLDWREEILVKDCVYSGLTGCGHIERFEKKLAETCGASHVVAMSSGTAALHMALVAAGVLPGDEVIVPALSFVATANAVCHAGAIPHFVDCLLTISPVKLRRHLESCFKRHRITAIIAVDLLGVPCWWHELRTIADDFGLILIEDACQALGSRIGKNMCGSFGDAAVLSFNDNKIVTTNGGGALLTNDPAIAQKSRHLSTTARLDHPWQVEHDAVAWNYRMGNINAAVGVAQLGRLETALAAKRELLRRYHAALDAVGGVSVLQCVRHGPGEANHWLVALELHRGEEEKRDALLQGLHDQGIRARAMFTPLHKLPMYRDHPRSDPKMLMSEDAERRIICLPSGVGLAQ